MTKISELLDQETVTQMHLLKRQLEGVRVLPTKKKPRKKADGS